MNENNDTSKPIPKSKEEGLLGLSQQDILSYLKGFNPNKALPKKVHELLIGYIFVQFLKEDEKEVAIIGFPAAKDWQDNCPQKEITIDWLIKYGKKLISDKDVDIKINVKNWMANFQVVRYVFRAGKKPCRELAQLIKYKCGKYKKTPNLNLIVSIECKPRITVDEIKNLLTTSNIPFEGIFLIMKASSERGHFTYSQLYPKQIIGKEIRIRLPI
nr:hypothetical protein [candidate division Zixibacteria bacterium]